MTDHSQLVKRLKWKRRPNGEDWTTECQIGTYGLGLVNGRYRAILRSVQNDQDHDEIICAEGSVKDAKAAAQADYTARILSALNHDAIDALQARVAELEAQRDVLIEALTPGPDTKADYIGEFAQSVCLHNPSFDPEDDDSVETLTHRVLVDWTTIKEIMAAIRARALLGRNPS